ncbi:hypothetical protein E2C01_085498 [Portunus trituberculatus]|uniref:Uncharacterized protein n=1 Tax=Portunus trituberculatus TaxID=210409 RepID=A0A5B7J6W3_PORTR|nr:hypothetical protein [Portunus trituberculatus]
MRTVIRYTILPVIWYQNRTMVAARKEMTGLCK